jgi:hypothetical protein
LSFVGEPDRRALCRAHRITPFEPRNLERSPEELAGPLGCYRPRTFFPTRSPGPSFPDHHPNCRPIPNRLSGMEPVISLRAGCLRSTRDVLSRSPRPITSGSPRRDTSAIRSPSYTDVCSTLETRSPRVTNGRIGHKRAIRVTDLMPLTRPLTTKSMHIPGSSGPRNVHTLRMVNTSTRNPWGSNANSRPEAAHQRSGIVALADELLAELALLKPSIDHGFQQPC